jgi:soluble lytic murein transglycosylase-like protein
MKRTRVPFYVVATLSFLVVPFDSPSDPVGVALVPPSEGPTFLPGNRLASSRAGAPLVSPADLAAALSPDRRAFELFPLESRDDGYRDFLQRFPYGTALISASGRHGVDGLLLAAVVETESHFSARRVSPRGAVGLMQVLPSTAAAFGKSGRDLYDPKVNLEVGTRYLGSLIEHFDGDLPLALAAYNAGPGAVVRHNGVPPYRETRQYVRKVLALYGEHRQSVWGEEEAAPPRSDETPLWARDLRQAHSVAAR